MTQPLLSVVIPFYNEADNVSAVSGLLAAALSAAKIPHELLLIDNGSTDATRRLAQAVADTEPGARVVVVERNRGYGGGVLAGLAASRGEVVGFMTGDGQVKPEAVVAVYRRLTGGGLDFCKALREVRHDGWKRAALSRWGNGLFRACFPVLRTQDINGTPKLMTRALYERLKPTSTDWFLDAEVVIKAHLLGASIAEVRVESPARQAGESNVRWTTVVEFLRNLARYRWGRALADWQTGSLSS